MAAASPGTDSGIAVVDGSNVAWEERGESDVPRMSNLVEMRRALEERGFDPIIVVDATLQHDGVVVSNDRFESYRDRHPWIDERRLPYMIVRGDVFLSPMED